MVAYATRHGSTGEVAAVIGEELSARGMEADVQPAGEVADLHGYQAAVIGSPVRFGQWLPDAVQFVKVHRETLARLPVAVFTTHILALDDSQASRERRQNYIRAVRSAFRPRYEAWFAGKVAFSQLSAPERLLSRAIRCPAQDRRDWPAIRAWARGLFRE